MPVSKETLDEIALSQREYDLIVEKLGREPTPVELGMFGSLWSEHCGYKYSKALLRMFPVTGKHVLVKPGEENAGIIDIGDGQVIGFKMESHNHPSYIEPYQGAATGVGGIVRDIFTMGLRPIALMNSLRFGPLSEPHNRYLFGGVVGGIAGYGNCLGIADVGGEIYFDQCYTGNPLVNALCLGIGRADNLIKARASGEGNLIMLVGADTGRDGLHGASGLASRTFEEVRELRSAVQVGNPFMEKLLIEACLELAGTDWIVGMQDCGAAGLTSAIIEAADKGNSGIDIDVSKVPRREKGMTPYEVMISESQERMIVIAKKGYENKVKALFDRWELHSDIIGRVTADGIAIVRDGGKVVVNAPVKILNTPPVYRLRPQRPGWLDEIQRLDLNKIKDIAPKKTGEMLLKLLASPNICSKHAVYRQYDHQVGDNTVVLPGSDAAVLRIQETSKAFSMVTDGNGRYCYVNPFIGGVIAVAEAARNTACSGARPMAITNCLNFGNPEKNDVYFQLQECIKGMTQACKKLKIPVISGNVSLYNETRDVAVFPTPVVGMVGLIKDVKHHCSSGFKQEGDIVFLIGEPANGESLGSSEYLEMAHGMIKGTQHIDIEKERRVQTCVIKAIERGLLNSAHDCSDGGLAVALAESCILGDTGFTGKIEVKGRLDAALFGEAQSRIVVSTCPKAAYRLETLALKHNVPLARMGVTGGAQFTIKGYIDLPVSRLHYAWWNGLLNY
ncbi:MAG: phosphoribosylformylglycinamidine synthase subunit PurL [Dehalococcoidia bacterium]|nr:phosphoribosylformylglycinamidine synthase subunit PurL [Dehalococcoidia bacterium]MDD5494672.1 phosphoribosylformylglycinamidine synthase subunit PurL [Dehalococcoidia bacterium]